MLQSEMRDVIAQGKQEVVIGVMPRAKKNSRLLHQVPVMFPDFLRSLERRGAIGRNIEFRGRILAGRRQWHHLQILARKHRTVHQHGRRNGSSDGTPRAWCSTRAINRLLSETSVSSRDRLRTALEHREPDRIPLDFGSTAVTGVHVSCVAAL